MGGSASSNGWRRCSERVEPAANPVPRVEVSGESTAPNGWMRCTACIDHDGEMGSRRSATGWQGHTRWVEPRQDSDGRLGADGWMRDTNVVEPTHEPDRCRWAVGWNGRTRWLESAQGPRSAGRCDPISTARRAGRRKTEAVYRRYAITSEADLREGVERLNGEPLAATGLTGTKKGQSPRSGSIARFTNRKNTQ